MHAQPTSYCILCADCSTCLTTSINQCWLLSDDPNLSTLNTKKLTVNQERLSFMNPSKTVLESCTLKWKHRDHLYQRKPLRLVRSGGTSPPELSDSTVSILSALALFVLALSTMLHSIVVCSSISWRRVSATFARSSITAYTRMLSSAMRLGIRSGTRWRLPRSARSIWSFPCTFFSYPG